MLAANGYPTDRIIADKYDDGLHELPYWRNIFPEFLEAMFTHNVAALTLGGLIDESRLTMDNGGSADEQDRIVIPFKANHIIFNSGVTDEEVKNGKQSYQPSDAAFNETTNAEQIYRIDLSQDATHGRGAEKEKYTYPAGSWSNDMP